MKLDPSSDVSSDKVAADETQEFMRAKTCAIERAEELQRILDPQNPSFIKSMQPSHVGQCFSMKPPHEFCKSHLPRENFMVTLMDEKYESYTVRFRVKEFRAGWKPFCISNKLAVGDALVFELVKKPTVFQVYVIRAFEGDVLQKSYSKPCAKQIAASKLSKSNKGTNKKRPRAITPTSMRAMDDEGSENSCGYVSEDYRVNALFRDLDRKSFDAAVRDLREKSNLPEASWNKYFELCHSQNAVLHENLIKRYPKLVDAIISEAVIIADGIKASKISTFMDDFPKWDQGLELFVNLGMNVGFLRDHLKQLWNFVSNSEQEFSKLVCQQSKIK